VALRGLLFLYSILFSILLFDVRREKGKPFISEGGKEGGVTTGAWPSPSLLGGITGKEGTFFWAWFQRFDNFCSRSLNTTTTAGEKGRGETEQVGGGEKKREKRALSGSLSLFPLFRRCEEEEGKGQSGKRGKQEKPETGLFCWQGEEGEGGKKAA